eukprot:TRINITY_DN569_c0_g1_i1.p1 TRINITY_DN569_c0_g1~~TRINITY_DN569_c0_g1_i1.p1  ORF type:complete len:264 (-),score=57.85 TRINITY_DN569_c0_g1_i1:135-926(-)
MAIQLPASLQPISKYLIKAKELAKADPVVSYHCKTYAVEQGLKIRDKADSGAAKLLMTMMDQMEREKASLGDQVGEVARTYLEGFALQVFKRADDQDRAGQADKATARAFVAASVFIEILRQFGEIPSDFVEKRKYALFKATDIMNALKRGERPKAGPPMGDGSNIPFAEGYGESGYVDSYEPLAPTSQPPQLPPAPTAAAKTYAQPYVSPAVHMEPVTHGAVDDDAIIEAEKCAKLAHQALAFQDVDTAVRNLKKALALLGQ